jgi:hypothetical protein
VRRSGRPCCVAARPSMAIGASREQMLGRQDCRLASLPRSRTHSTPFGLLVRPPHVAWTEVLTHGSPWTGLVRGTQRPATGSARKRIRTYRVASSIAALWRRSGHLDLDRQRTSGSPTATSRERSLFPACLQRSSGSPHPDTSSRSPRCALFARLLHAWIWGGGHLS